MTIRKRTDNNESVYGHNQMEYVETSFGREDMINYEKRNDYNIANRDEENNDEPSILV